MVLSLNTSIADICHNHTTGGGVIFFELVYVLAKTTQNFGLLWPILTILLQIYALFVVLFTGLNNAVAYQKGQLSGMSDDIIARVMEYLILFMEP